MKLFVISDTHGKLDKVLDVWQKLKEIDLIVHLGDTARDADRLSAVLGREVVRVMGNNDGACGANDSRILKTEYGDILLTHGHLQQVKSGLQNLIYRTIELGCKAVLFGHTHRPVYMQAGEIFLVNPGSLTFPADGTAGSYAIVRTSADAFSASIIDYARIFSEEQK